MSANDEKKNIFDVVSEEIITEFAVTGKYGRYRRISGMEYLVLNMVDWGTSNKDKPKIIDGMKAFSIPEDMFPLIVSILFSLEDRGLLKLKRSDAENSFTNKITFAATELEPKGRELLDSNLGAEEGSDGKKVGLIRIDNAESVFSSRMFCYYDRETRYAKASEVEKIAAVSKPVPTAVRKGLKEFVAEHAKMFVSDDSDDSSVLEVVVSGTELEPSGSFSYKEHIELVYDYRDGTFSLNLKDGYVPDMKHFYNKENLILGLLEKEYPDLFDLGPRDFNVNSFSNDAPEGPHELILPKNFVMPEGIRLCSNRVTNLRGSISSEDIGCDLAVIAHNKGYKYSFVWDKVRLKGSEGAGIKRRMVAVEFMTPQEVRQYKKRFIEGKDIMVVSHLRDLIDTASRSGDYSLYGDKLKAYILGSDIEGLRKILDKLNEAYGGNRFGKSSFDSDLTEILCNKISDGFGLDSAKSYLEACHSRKFHLGTPDVILTVLRKHGIEQAFDWADSIKSITKKTETGAITEEGIFATMVMDAVMRGRDYSGRTTFSNNIAKARGALSALKDLTRLTPSESYSFDYESITDEDKSAVAENFADLRTAMNYLVRTYPAIRENVQYRTLDSFMEVYEAISKFVSKDRLPVSRADIIEETNVLNFTVSLRKVLDKTLVRLLKARKSLKAQLKDLAERKTVSDETLAAISEFATMSDRICRHDVACRNSRFNKLLRRKWTEAVFELAEIE